MQLFYISEIALQHVSMVFRSENKWEVIEPLPDIGKYLYGLLFGNTSCGHEKDFQ